MKRPKRRAQAGATEPAVRLHDMPEGPMLCLRSTALYDQLLRDAIQSLRHPLRQTGAMYSGTKADRQPERIARRLYRLQAWFLADRDFGPFSFHRCCLMLSLDPDAVRERLRADGVIQPPETLVKSATKTPPSARMRRAA